MPARVCVVGAESMDPDLILEWIGAGKLPNLARLRARGVVGRVINPPRLFSGGSWPTFYTGVTPARHDQYLRTIYDPQTCIHRPFRPERDQVDAFWLGPGWEHKRTAVIDIPQNSPDERINGLQVVEWGTHDRRQPGARTVPADLARDLSSRFGADPLGRHCSTYEGATGMIELRDRLIQRVRTKRDVACHYLASAAWDLFITVFDDTHCAGHRFWHLHDPTHSRHDPEIAAILGRTVEDVYVEIDRALGAILGLLDADATTVFLSSHGMWPAFDANSVFDEILRRIEGLAPRSPDYKQTKAKQLATAKGLSDRLPQSLQRALAPVRRRFGRGRLGERLDEERRKRKCFWFPTHDTCGGIRINLAGRESGGIVRPGDDYEKFVRQLVDDLHGLRDGRSGEPIVAEVVRSTDLDCAGYAGELPDLIVRWSKASLSWIESPKVGRLETLVFDGRTGDHDPAMRGIFFATGVSVPPGLLSDPVRLEDFAPTISSLLGAPPGETEGAPIAAICAPLTTRAAAR